MLAHVIPSGQLSRHQADQQPLSAAKGDGALGFTGEELSAVKEGEPSLPSTGETTPDVL